MRIMDTRIKFARSGADGRPQNTSALGRRIFNLGGDGGHCGDGWPHSALRYR